MKDMFFMGIKGLAKADFDALHKAANEKISGAGFKPVSVCSAIAIHDDCGMRSEKGVVVSLPDGDKMNFYRALNLKDTLRHGTYTVLLNEISLPNCSFEVLIKRDADVELSLETLAEAWLKKAVESKGITGIFVSGFVYETEEGFWLVGNANPTMAGNMFLWQKAVEGLSFCLGASYPSFYAAELSEASVLPRHRRIGYLTGEEEKKPVVHESIH